MNSSTNVDPAELSRFSALASRWWDPDGEFRTLHRINPPRLAFIRAHASLTRTRVVDIGCGGGILSESLAAAGAEVSGIDLSEPLLEVARLHQIESGVQVDYRCVSAEALATEQPEAFDILTSMELLEHLPDPAAFVATAAELVKPGGLAFFSTLNRTPKAYVFAILGGEYLLNLIPRGTHDYARFIRPGELDTWARKAGLDIVATTGLTYHPLTHQVALGTDVDVNYLVCYRKPSRS